MVNYMKVSQISEIGETGSRSRVREAKSQKPKAKSKGHKPQTRAWWLISHLYVSQEILHPGGPSKGVVEQLDVLISVRVRGNEKVVVSKIILRLLLGPGLGLRIGQ